MEKLENGFLKTKLAIGVAGFCGYLVLILLSGASLIALLVFWWSLLFGIYLPGRLFSSLLHAQAVVPNGRVPLAILYGTGFMAVCACVLIRFHLQNQLGLLFLAVSVCAVLFLQHKAPLKKNGIAEKLHDGVFLSRFALWGVLTLLFGFCISVKNACPSVAGEILLNPDLLWNIGNANSFALGFPPQDIRFSMVRLSYHYLTELIGGVLAMISHLRAYDIFAFYYGPAILFALLECLYALGLSFFGGHRGKALLLTFSMFLFNCASLWTALYTGQGIFLNSNLRHLVTNINSQASAVIFSCIFLLLFMGLVRKQFYVSMWMVLSTICSFVLLCFAKGPAAAIIVCSFSITMLFVLARKPQFAKALLTLIGVIAVFCVVYFFVFASGANTSMRVGNKTLEASAFNWVLNRIMERNVYLWRVALVVAAVLNFFCMAPVQVLLYGKGLLRDIRHFWELPAERLLAHGVVVGGVMAYHLFWHPSFSQSYFVFIAIFFVNLLAVDEIDQLGKGFFQKAAACAAALGLCTTAVMYLNFAGSGARQLLRNLDIIEKYPYETVTTAGDETAMQWLNANTKSTVVFATNRIHASLKNGDGISNLYTALSARQAYMEGYTYAITNMGVSEAVVAEKIATNTALFSAASSKAEIRSLCAKNGISYLVYSTQFAGDTSQLAAFPLVFQNDSVQIYQIS